MPNSQNEQNVVTWGSTYGCGNFIAQLLALNKVTMAMVYTYRSPEASAYHLGLVQSFATLARWAFLHN